MDGKQNDQIAIIELRSPPGGPAGLGAVAIRGSGLEGAGNTPNFTDEETRECDAGKGSPLLRKL